MLNLEALLASGLSAVGFKFNGSVTWQQLLFNDLTTIRHHLELTVFASKQLIFKDSNFVLTRKFNDSTVGSRIGYRDNGSTARFDATVGNVFNGSITWNHGDADRFNASTW